MDHGTAAYFDESRRNRRRLAALSVAVGLGMLLPILVLRDTPLGRSLRQSRIMRFGFAGPPRYVELMQIETRPTNLTMPRDIGEVVLHSGRRGDPGPAVRRGRRGVALRNAPITGANGEAGGGDLVARAIASQGAVPVMQSSELVIEELVRPEYPEHARNREIEGHVAVLARVDTLGNVAEAEIMTTSGTPELDEASLRAVRRCRFRPYRDEGKLTEVYAVFRFAFRIY